MARSKFNVNSDKAGRTYDGIVFDSAMEMKYYRDVVLPQVESGTITKYELQKPYVLQPKFKHGDDTVRDITYVADYYIEYSDGSSEVIDIKGHPDSIAKLKRKMFWYVYPTLTYRWVCYSKIDGGWVDWEVVDKGRKERKKKKKEQLLKEKENKHGKDDSNQSDQSADEVGDNQD